jgi:peptidoglycan hydrolase CwlO-like protein
LAWSQLAKSIWAWLSDALTSGVKCLAAPAMRVGLLAGPTQMGADTMSDAQQDKTQADERNKAFIERMTAMMQGQVEPPNEQVAYLLKAFKEDNQRLVAIQEEVLKLRGRLETREADLRHWDDQLNPVSDTPLEGEQPN